MNHDLSQWYSGLQAYERSKLQQLFAGSPKASTLIAFLEKNQGKNFRTSEAVEAVYSGERKEYGVLQNRYFKLRKKLVDSIKSKGGSSGSYALAAEEAAYFNCRTLISRSNYATAKKELTELRDKCHKLNIFELLPQALNQLIYCNQALNVFHENEALFREQEDAVRLQHDLGTQQLLSRVAFHKCVTKGFASTQKELRQMKLIALRNKAWPRFLLNYHFTSFSLGSISSGNKVHALSRHLGDIEKILAKHPSLPAITYEYNYLPLQKFYLCSARGSYFFLKGDMEHCFLNFSESWDILEKTPELRVRKSDNYFRNKMRIQISAERYPEALATCDEWMEHLKSQKRREEKHFVYAGMMEVYSYAYPLLRCGSPDFLLSRMDEHIRSLKKNDPQRLMGEACAHKAMFQYVHQRFNEALETSRSKECIAFLKFRKMDVYSDLFSLPLAYSEVAKKHVQDKIKKQLFSATNADAVFPLKWALRMVKHAKGN